MEPDCKTIPHWPSKKHLCSNDDLQRIFGVTRSIIDRWAKERPGFPRKVRLGDEHGSIVRFYTSDVQQYLSRITKA